MYPLDIAKTQLQMDKSGKYKGLMHCFNTIRSEGGMGALYRYPERERERARARERERKRKRKKEERKKM